jgi:carbon monoxide dehydrogenase subunit G
MAVRFENSFAVPAPLEHAWRIATDVPRVVVCMPGTELTELIDERRFRATARVRVGPVELQFAGEGELYDIDPAAHMMKLRASGRETKGRGSFQTDMSLAFTRADGEALVRVATNLTLSGAVAQYGRGSGMVKTVAEQLTAEFARNFAALFPHPGAAQPEQAPAQPPGATPISVLALLFATLKTTLRRWFGARS